MYYNILIIIIHLVYGLVVMLGLVTFSLWPHGLQTGVVNMSWIATQAESK